MVISHDKQFADESSLAWVSRNVHNQYTVHYLSFSSRGSIFTSLVYTCICTMMSQARFFGKVADLTVKWTRRANWNAGPQWNVRNFSLPLENERCEKRRGQELDFHTRNRVDVWRSTCSRVTKSFCGWSVASTVQSE